ARRRGRGERSRSAGEAGTPKGAGREIARRERSGHAEGGGGRGREASLGGLRPPKTKSERAKVPLPLHESDERSGFSRGSRDVVALLATCLLLPKRRTQLQSAIERSSIGWTDGTFACRTSAER